MGSRTGWVEDLAVPGEGLGRSRGGLTSKIHLAVDGHGRPLSILVTPGQAGDHPHLLALLRLAYYRAEVVIATISLWLRDSQDRP